MAVTNFNIEIPVANAVKFTVLDQVNSQRANFDQIKFSDAHFTAVVDRKFYQVFEKLDPLSPQVYTNFPKRKIEILDCVGAVLYSSDLYLRVQYTGLKYRSQCNFTSTSDGKLVIYFTEGFEYSDEDFTVPGDYVVLDGRLPNINAAPGNVLRYNIDGSGIQTGVIQEIVWLPELQAEGYKVNVPASFSDPVPGVVEVTYNKKDNNLYHVPLNLSTLAEGAYYLRLSFGVNDYEVIKYISEPISIAEYDEDTLAIDYSHVGEFEQDDKWGYVYLEGWFNRIRLAANFHKFLPGGEIENYTNDYGTPEKLRTVPSRQLILSMFVVPGWVVDKLNVVWGHDTLIINEYYWELKDFGQFNIINKTDIGDYEITLEQKNDRRFFTKQLAIDLTAYFEPASIEAITEDGAEVQAYFRSNTSGEFAFVELPDWIHPDHDTFVDGDLVTFLIDENATLFDRSTTLVATCPDFSGLTASIFLSQYHQAEPPEFLSVENSSVVVGPNSGSFVLDNVTSSGDYDITYAGVTTFPTIKQLSGAQVKISAPSSNPGPAVRTGTVRLTLQSNPAIFVDISVTQSVLTGLFYVDPTGHTFSSGGGTFLFDIFCSPGCRWQASSVTPWIYVDPGITVGPGTINAFIDGRDYDPLNPGSRFGSITITDIDNPSSYLTINITQTA